LILKKGSYKKKKDNSSSKKNKNTRSGYIPKDDVISSDAVVIEARGNGMFKCTLSEGNVEVLGHISGKIRSHYIQIIPGDKVVIELSPYDVTRGRIVYRYRT